MSRDTIQNLLLKALAPSALDALMPYMSELDLPLKFPVVEAGVPTEDLVFIETGLASMVADTSDDESVEVGHVGFEGVCGSHVFLTVAETQNRTFMQVAGHGLSVPVGVVQELTAADLNARELFLKYLYTTHLQLSHSALANARYGMHERLARWLLMCHDRVRSDDLPLTHEFLSLMLGVRRSGVTNELHILEGVHAIKATRGNIRVLDREKLIDMAGGCYGLPEREYERVLRITLPR
jgi:CRP-like cAMP-binding protein